MQELYVDGVLQEFSLPEMELLGVGMRISPIEGHPAEVFHLNQRGPYRVVEIHYSKGWRAVYLELIHLSLEELRYHRQNTALSFGEKS